MPGTKFKFAHKCINPGLPDVNLITVSDVINAYFRVIDAESGTDRSLVSKRKSALRVSAVLICRYVGEQKKPRQKKTPENTLIAEIIGIEDGLSNHLDDLPAHRHQKTMQQLRLLIAGAQAMGFTHEAFAAREAWAQLKFGKVDRVAKRLMNALIRAGIHPEDVSKEHIHQWRQLRKGQRCTSLAIKQSISQFKLAIRRARLEASFPKLDTELACPSYGTAQEDMHPNVQKQLEKIVQILAKLDEDQKIQKCESSRKCFVGEVSRLCGYAELHGMTVSDLNQIFNQDVITECARWGYNAKKWKQANVEKFLRTLHSVLVQVSPYDTQNWDWMYGLLSEFFKEPESQKEARQAEKAFNYDYDTLNTIPRRISERRKALVDSSRDEIEWTIHCELLLLLLLTAPWPPQCIASCRIFSNDANLIKIGGSWYFRFSPSEVPFRRLISQTPLPERLVPLLELYIAHRGKHPGFLFHSKRGHELSAKSLTVLVESLTEEFVGASVPTSAFRPIFAYWWLSLPENQGLNGYTSLASILWISIHACRFRFDKEYREKYLAAHPTRGKRRRRPRVHSGGNSVVASFARNELEGPGGLTLKH